MAELFGFTIQKAQKDQGLSGKTFTDPTPDDGAIEVAGGGFFFICTRYRWTGTQ